MIHAALGRHAPHEYKFTRYLSDCGQAIITRLASPRYDLSRELQRHGAGYEVKYCRFRPLAVIANLRS